MTRLTLLIMFFAPNFLLAADVTAISPTGGVLKMVLGLLVVLAVMALVTWVLKRMMPGAGSQQSSIRVVGGVSVGTRERVVVLEVAGRWLVVGVAPGQVSAIANLEAGSVQPSESTSDVNGLANVNQQINAPAFAQWLKKSAEKFKQH